MPVRRVYWHIGTDGDPIMQTTARTRVSLLATAPLLLVPILSWAHSPQPAPVSSVTITREIHAPLDDHFNLIDQDDRPVSDHDFRGAPVLIYFGYTNCPDACPLDAQTISAVVDLLDTRGERLTPIFITVDPERDTPAELKKFLFVFHPRFVGLTGPIAEIHRVTAAYGAEDDHINERSASDYDILHPAIAYLLGTKGEFIDLIRLSDDPQTVVDNIESLLRQQR